jgi:hypothetical protein
MSDGHEEELHDSQSLKTRQGEWSKAIICTAQSDSHHHSGRGHSSCDDPHLRAEFRQRKDRKRRGHFGGWLFVGGREGQKRSER